MKNYLVADRYARGLDRALSNDTERETAMVALRALGKLYRGEHELRSVLSNPAIPQEQQAAVLHELLERLAAPALARNLLDVMLQRGRVTLLPDVAQLFAAMTDERMNRAGARVTSAVELTSDQADRIVRTLEVHSGMKVRADFEVDPDILGGVIAHIRGTVIDGSLRARVQRLKESLLPEEKISG